MRDGRPLRNRVAGTMQAGAYDAPMLERGLHLPSALKANARFERLGSSSIPALIVHPTWEAGDRAPVLMWMHGRTARKEIDPGRYLRLMRSGIGVCAVDLPGHGDRFEAALQHPAHTLDLVLQMTDEIDELIDAMHGMDDLFDRERMAVGGMSAGGMATMARLCHDHPFVCAAVEASTGSWRHQLHREMFRGQMGPDIVDVNPMENLDDWREIPFLAIHSVGDAWVSYEGQRSFVEAVRGRYERPELVEMVADEVAGAPFEHAGFGKFASEAKDVLKDFLRRHLLGEGAAEGRNQAAERSNESARGDGRV